MTRFLKYGYTGWQWKVSAGTYLLSTVPKLEQLVNKMNEKMNCEDHNHWIVTRYKEGKDNIGMHSDKVKDW